MLIIGNMNEENKEKPKHVDAEDFIIVLFHFGFPTKGREISYCSGLTRKYYGELQLQIQCDNGYTTI